MSTEAPPTYPSHAARGVAARRHNAHAWGHHMETVMEVAARTATREEAQAELAALPPLDMRCSRTHDCERLDAHAPHGPGVAS